MCRELSTAIFSRHEIWFLLFKPVLKNTRVSEARETDQAIDLQDRAILLFAVHWSQIGHGVMFLVDFAFHHFQSAEFKPGRLSVSQELSHKLSVDISADILILVGRVIRRCRARLAVCSFVCTEHLSGLIFFPRHEI